MRTRLLLLVLLITGNIYAQQGWVTQTSGTTTWINGVDFVDTKTGWAVGNDGTILHTSDGATWATQQSNTPEDLFSVTFVDHLLGWIVGADGVILHTSNGGINWATQTSGGSYDLQSVFFMDLNFGWIAGTGGTALVTDNGGLLWTLQPTPTVKDLRSIFFVDYLNGWCAGKEGTMMNSVDGGITWLEQPNHPLNGTLIGFNGLYFMDTQIGWAVAKSGNILRTNNGGNNWSKQTTGTTNGFNDVHFFNTNDGYVVGDGGMIKFTTNGGALWQDQTSPLNKLLLSIDFPVQDTGWITGNSGTILYTNNGGICPRPDITLQPVSQSVCPGTLVTFSVTTTDPTAKFQWYKNNVALAGDTTNTIEIDSATILNAGSYYCELNNDCGPTKSSSAVLSLKGPAMVTGQPANDTAHVGEKVTIKLTASGTSISFQWFKNGVEIPGATNYQFVIDSVVQADSGYYSCRITNICNIVMSDSAFLKVNDFSGIITIENSASMKFYPNPTNGLINIEIDKLKNENTSIHITNYNGQIIYHKEVGNKTGLIYETIDLSNKSKGVYFIRLQSGKAVLTEKIVLY